ncbi:asparagine synthase [Amycolatopsis rhizosphaerae]|uniref:asparagine synthase (glutamine-hydrolyzing) n=1 Tax=Amycolatopsis rhizosphaerae TaxID=2053003 RepID=A0A558BGH9_9PSEU|nr:asparagine synthase-related protein [Amycolatopsis rhizosphaerae]TVT35613.1 asparagine synthase [Amycolatopsis rhizosphaerae]
MVTSGDSWFVVLADQEGTRSTAHGLRSRADQWVPHPSGRPWLLARGHDLLVAEVPSGRLAVIGQCPVTAAELATRVAGLSGPADLDRLAVELPGSFHLLATVGGEVRVQGSASGLRRVCYGRAGDIALASDRADVVAALLGAEVDPERLALWLLFPGVPAPLSDVSPWRGVRKVPPGAFLHLDGAGGAHERTWWTPPEPSLSLAEGAAKLAETLSANMASLARESDVLGADLSGGLDSTSLCFLAARAGARVSAVTYVGRDPGNDDADWATSAARLAAGTFTHRLLQPDELPLSYAGLWEPGEPMDEPFIGLRDAARIAFGVRQAGRSGARHHLSGFGADEVLEAPPAALHTIVRQQPRLASSYLRGQRSKYRWPLAAVLSAVADRRSYPDWLADAAAEVAVFGSARDTSPALHWDGPFRVPPWVTPSATHAIRGLMRQAASGARPLAPTRGQHAALAVTRRGTSAYRLVQRFVGRTGHRLVLPFLDDQVLTTCLSVRLHERTTPWRYKPLLVEAMRGFVPDGALSRSTKGNIAGELYLGLRRSRDRLAELLDDPVLGRLGLVDVDSLRTACLALYPPTVPIAVVEATLACEVWLRAVTGTRTPIVKAR